MTARASRILPVDPKWFLLASLLAMVAGGGASTVRAQERTDTLRTRPEGVEPAGLDSLPTGDLEAPIGAADTSAPAPDSASTERVYVDADSLSTFFREGERLQELIGDVFVRQDTTRLQSEYALRYLDREELLFVGDVAIYERGDTLRADSVRYDRAQEVGHARGNVRLTDGDVVLRADRGTYFAAEKRSVFPDSVVLVDSTRVLRADHGTYWSDEQRAEFGGGVRMTEPGTIISADSLTYYRDRDRSVAVGNVFIDRRGGERAGADTTTQTYLFGDRVDNRERRRYTRVEGNSLLVQVRRDSTGAPTDSLVVRAQRLEAFRTDTHRRLIAVNRVRIWQSDLAAVADSVVYDRVVAAMSDSVAQRDVVPIDTTRPPPDSIRLRAGAPPADSAGPVAEPPGPPDSVDVAGAGDPETGQAPSAQRAGARPTGPPSGGQPDTSGRGRSGARLAQQTWKTPTARSEQGLPLEEIRLYRTPMTWFEDTQVWGDSIRVTLRERSPDTIFVRGAAFAARKDTALGRIHQLKARSITAFFEADSLDRIRARPNARAIYFLGSEQNELMGAKKASGPRFVLWFAGGKVRRVKWAGPVEGTAYRSKESVPDRLQLEGFTWMPDQRPRRSELLRDPRVHERLNLEVGPRSRPIVRRSQGPSSVSGRVRPSDSTRRPFVRDTSATSPRPPFTRPPVDSLPARRRTLTDTTTPGKRPVSSPDSSEFKRNRNP